MPNSINPTRRTRSQRPRLDAVAMLITGILVAGCGGSSRDPAAATVSGAPTAAIGSANVASTTPGLAFARCMRANGVPNFPDPESGRGLGFNPAGINLGAPAYREAQAKCQRFLPNNGLAPGTTTHPSTETKEKLLRIAVCMRKHGVPHFPDPTTSIPSDLFGSGIREVTNFDGAILLFPASINLEAPAYRQALAACGAPPLGLPH